MQPEDIISSYFIHDCSVTVIEGKDSITHLNRIITSDIREIKNLDYHQSLICDANGKIIDAIEISSISNQLLILGISNNSKTTRDLIVSGIHWNEEVKMMNGDGALSILSIYSSNLEQIQKILGENSVNEEYNIWKEYNDYYTLQIKLINDVQVNILIQTNKIADFIDKIEKKGVLCSSIDSWNNHRIENGIFSDEEYAHKPIPSELGLDDIVNLKKGCYPGQEIHARLESRGKVTKEIMRYTTDVQLQPGVYKSNLGRKVRVTSSSKNIGFAVVSVKESNEIILEGDISLLTEKI